MFTGVPPVSESMQKVLNKHPVTERDGGGGERRAQERAAGFRSGWLQEAESFRAGRVCPPHCPLTPADADATHR